MILPSSAGCSFIANRQLHLVDALLEIHDLTDERDEYDSVVIANVSDDLIANVQAYFIPEGQSSEEEFGDPVTLAPGETWEYALRNSFAMGEFTQFRSGGMYRIESDAPIIAYQHAPYRAFVGNDSSMLLPESTLGENYVVASYNPHSAQASGLGRPSYFEMIAVEDDTEVEWLAQFAATSGNGLPIEAVETGEWSNKVRMNRFETLRVTASYNANQKEPDLQEVSGTVIRSNKPIWVVGGSRCSRVPASPDLGFCDPLQELLIPMRYWGSTYVAPAPPDRGVDDDSRVWWRIYGAEEGATVEANIDVDKLPYTFESRGDFVEIDVPHGTSFVLTSETPFMPVGYLQSRQDFVEPPEGTPKVSDPAMYQLVPAGQYLNRYVFVAPPEWTVHWVQITREQGAPDVILDGDPVPDGDFNPVGGFEVANVEVVSGFHRVESEGDFGLTQLGYAFTLLEGCAPPLSGGENPKCDTSYAYPGGMKSEQIYVP